MAIVFQEEAGDSPVQIISDVSQMPDPVLKDGVLTIVPLETEYLFKIDIDSPYPLAFPGAGKVTTIKTVNGAKWNYTGTDACFRDKDAEGIIELQGQTEFTANNGNMFDILAVTGEWSLQGITIPRFRDCISLGKVSGGASGASGFNSFFGSITGFYDGLIMENCYFAEESSMFIAGNDSAKLAYDGQTVDFTVGEVVTGALSGAFGTVRIDYDNGVDGVLVLSDITGEFQNDEDLTGDSTGVAVVDGVLQNVDMLTVQGTATSGTVNMLNLTFYASKYQNLFNLNPEIQAGVDSINLRGNQSEGILNASAFADGSLTQKDLKVFSSGNTFFPDSKIIGSAYIKGGATATDPTTSGDWYDIDFGVGGITAGSNIERFTLTNAQTGERRYDGLIDFSGEILSSFTCISTGGARVFKFRYVKDSGSGFEVLTDDIEVAIEIGATVTTINLIAPITLQNGDLIKPQVSRLDGTSTITVQNFSDNIS